MTNQFHDTTYGKIALRKFGDVGEAFEIFECGWLDAVRGPGGVMEVLGAEFRVAKRGPRKGERVIEIPGTRRKVFVTWEELRDD